METREILGRTAWAALLALVLGLRLLSPAGFMPAFERGAVTIIACPDAGGASRAAHRQHHGHKRFDQSCPYAAASSPGTLVEPPAAMAAAAMLYPATRLLVRAPTLGEQRRSNLRPPPTGPPTRS